MQLQLVQAPMGPVSPSPSCGFCVSKRRERRAWWTPKPEVMRQGACHERSPLSASCSRGSVSLRKGKSSQAWKPQLASWPLTPKPFISDPELCSLLELPEPLPDSVGREAPVAGIGLWPLRTLSLEGLQGE